MTGRKRAKRAVVKKQRKNVILEMLGQENIVTERRRGKRQKLFHSDRLWKAAGAMQTTRGPDPFCCHCNLSFPSLRLKQWTWTGKKGMFGTKQCCQVKMFWIDSQCQSTVHINIPSIFLETCSTHIGFILVFIDIWVFCAVLFQCPQLWGFFFNIYNLY